MTGVLAVLAAILVLGLILRVGTVALSLTGISREVARFQVRSAFFGAGYTTAEAESIMNHPVRRRIVQLLIVWGAIGLTSILGSSVLTLTRQDGLGRPLLTLVGGFAVIYVLFSIRPIDRLLVRIIERLLRRYTDLDAADYDALLRLSSDYSVTRFTIRPGGRLDGHSIAELIPRVEGVVVLGIDHPDGTYVGAPPIATTLRAGDTLTVYGRDDVLKPLANVPARPIDQES